MVAFEGSGISDNQFSAERTWEKGYDAINTYVEIQPFSAAQNRDPSIAAKTF